MGSIISTPTYDGEASLEQQRIIAVDSYTYQEPNLNQYIHDKENTNVLLIPSRNHLDRMIDLVGKKRYNVFVSSEIATEYYLRGNRYENVLVADEKSLSHYYSYISINPKIQNAKLILDQFNKRFREIYDDGTLQKIYKKYGVTRKIELIKE